MLQSKLLHVFMLAAIGNLVVSISSTQNGCCTSDVDADKDGFTVCYDCNDEDASVNPNATERCDGVDNNCDDQIDEGVQQSFYQDLDGDGYGNTDAAMLACSPPANFVALDEDCDDSKSEVNPSKNEACFQSDGIDNDCDGWIDAADTSSSSTAEEICGDGQDNDCDGAVDEDAGCQLPQRSFCDADGDGYGNPLKTTTAPDSDSSCARWILKHGDCNDGDNAVHPLATETKDGKDSDCGGSDEQDVVLVPPGSSLYNPTQFPYRFTNLKDAFDTVTTLLTKEPIRKTWLDTDAGSAVVQGPTIWIWPGRYESTNDQNQTAPGDAPDQLCLNDTQSANCTVQFRAIQPENKRITQDPNPSTVLGCTSTTTECTGVNLGQTGDYLTTNYRLEGLKFESRLIATPPSVKTVNGVPQYSNLLIDHCQFTGNPKNTSTTSSLLPTANLKHINTTVRYTLFKGESKRVNGISSQQSALLSISDSSFVDLKGYDSVYDGGSALYGHEHDLVELVRLNISGCSNYPIQLLHEDETFKGQYLLTDSAILNSEGGIYYYDGTDTTLTTKYGLTINRSRFMNNSNTPNNWLMYLSAARDQGERGGRVEIRDSYFLDNMMGLMYVSELGGKADTLEDDTDSALQWRGLRVINSYFRGNDSSANDGANSGGIFVSRSNALIENSHFEDNTAYDAAVLFAGDQDGASIRMSNCSLVGNASKNNNLHYTGGAAITLSLSGDLKQTTNGVTNSVVLDHLTVVGNQAEEYSGLYSKGAIYISTSGASEYTPVRLTNSILAYNTPGNLYVSDKPKTTPSTYAGYTCLVDRIQRNDFYNPTGTGDYDQNWECQTEASHVAATITCPPENEQELCNLADEPKFLTYNTSSGLPSSLHLSTSSPLIGKAKDTDADGSPGDLGLYGGPLGDGLDLDLDGLFSYFWPGTFTDIPSSVSPACYDAHDGYNAFFASTGVWYDYGVNGDCVFPTPQPAP